jgi:hypothetical protein
MSRKPRSKERGSDKEHISKFIKFIKVNYPILFNEIKDKEIKCQQ